MNTSSQERKAERGQGLVEYALILVLVAVAVIGILAMVGPGVSNVYCTVVGTFNKAGNCTGSTSSATQTPGTLTSTTYAVTSNQYRVYVRYNGNLQDGVSISCTGSSGPVEAHNDGGGSYVATLTSSFHGSLSCSLSYQSTTGSFSGSFS